MWVSEKNTFRNNFPKLCILKTYWKNIDLIKSIEKTPKNVFLPVGHLGDQGGLEVPKIQIGFKRLSQKKQQNVIWETQGTSLCASISAIISIALTIKACK